MGNAQSHGSEWNIIGRQREVEKATKLITGRINFYQFLGLKKIGKSRLMSEVYKTLKSDCTKWTCLWKDFQYESNLNTPSEWIRIFLTAFDNFVHEKSAFLESVAGGTFQCNKCTNCLDFPTDKSIKCSKWTTCLEKAVDMLINSLKNSDRRIILFLDNVDKLMDTNPDIKDCFLKFLKCRSERFKMVVSSTKKVSIGGPDISTMEVEPLSCDDTLKLLYITTDGIHLEYSECVPDTENMFCTENEVFTPENRVCLELISQLCDGLPLAAIMSGSLLTEYEGMFSPVELLEILTQVRMKTLSPDNCPPDDRLDIYRGEMQQVKELDEQFTSFFENLTEKQADRFSLQDALAASGKKDITSASLKNDVLKPMLDRCVISVKKMSREHQWRFHGILREANTALTVFGKVSSEPDATAAVMKFTKENAKLIGLELDDDVLCDAKAFEHAIRRLSKLTTEEDTETECEVVERLDATQGVTIPSQHNLAGNAQNNLSLSDNDNQHGNILDTAIICNNHMNIRVPVEHCMAADGLTAIRNNTDKAEVHYTKLDNISVTTEDIRQGVEHQETSIAKTTKTMESSHCFCNVGIQGDQANKLYGYNNALHMNACTRTVNGYEDLPPPYTSVDIMQQYKPTDGTVSNLKRNTCKCNENISGNIHVCNSRETMTPIYDADTELLDINRHSSCNHDVKPNNCNLTTHSVAHGHSQRGQNIGENGIHSRPTANCILDRHELPVTSGNDSKSHLGNCPVHDMSISEHNCSYTGPPGLIYEPPPSTQNNLGGDNSHLCVMSINPSTNKSAVCGIRTNQYDNSRDLTFTSSCPYDSQCGPSALQWNSFSNREQQTLPNQLTSNDSIKGERDDVQPSHDMNKIQ